MDIQSAIGTLKKCVESILENNIDVFKSLVPGQISPDTYFDSSIIPQITLKYNPVPLIYLAVAYDSILCLQYLIDLGEDLTYVGPDNSTLLITAAKMNNLNSARLLIAQNAIDVNAKGKHDNTALIYAAKNGNVDMIRLLLTIPGIDIECKNYIGTTPVLFSAIGCSLASLKLLVEAGANINTENDEHFSVANVAAINGNADIIEYLMQFDNVDFNHHDCEGSTPLFNACRFNQVKVLMLLLKIRKIDVNSKCGKNEMRPLHIAADRDNVESIELLFTRRDLDVNAKDINGRTALHVATEMQHKKAIFALLNHPCILPNEVDNNDHSAFSIALSLHNFGLITMFVSDPDINLDVERLKDSDLLQNFASKGNIEAVVGLVQRGFEPDRLDQFGRTALTIALGNGDVEMVRVLLGTRQIDINRMYRNSESLLHLATLNKKAARCLRLIMLYPDVNLNATDKKGNTALHLAACTQTINAVDILLSDPRVEKNHVNNEGLTPLHLAVLTGDTDVVELFLDSSAVDLTILTPKGNNVLTLSMIENKYKIISMLVDRPEIDINTFFKGKGTILGAAVIDGQIELVQKLLNNDRTRITNVGPILIFIIF
ncbi:Ankyrin repeat and FYVE domain-containing protein 1 [Tritrichomonas musculus]|uniref:Ankyrin repeat and FYVE domain-containing protein 1 n=1 Tax=Tritrichomonas musculus TaxID=1915356 RepID=A0ABR2JTS6_9EUKA